MEGKKCLLVQYIFCYPFIFGTSSLARDQINIVGSSTVFPFSTAVAERFGKSTDFKTPVVESTGSGGGMKLFCAGTGASTPDVTNASRRIKNPKQINVLKMVLHPSKLKLVLMVL